MSLAVKELRDQGAHGAFLAVMALPAILWGFNPFTGAWLGFCACILREITEEGEVSWPAFKRALGSRNDLIGWIGFGLLIGLFAMLRNS